MNLDGLVAHALARIALNIEKVAGPSDPDNPVSVQSHQKQLAILDTDLIRTKLHLQDGAGNNGFVVDPDRDRVIAHSGEPKQLVLF